MTLSKQTLDESKIDESTSSEANVDYKEIDKFEAIADLWWDETGKFKPLHDINPLRLNYIEQQIGSLAELKILDVGCGGGILTEAMAKRNARVTGIDMAQKPIAVARIHSIKSGLDIIYRQVNTEQFSQENEQQFDVITCLEMLEHVPDPASIVKACSLMLKPGGHIFFSTINRNKKAWLFAIVGAEYVLKLLPKGTHDYKKFIKPHELALWCRKNQLLHQDAIGMTYNPLLRQYKLTPKNLDVNYIVHAYKSTV